MNSRVQKMVQLAKADLESKRGTLAAQAREQLELYGHMLEQIKIWMKTGFHPKDKIISLWDTTARAISKGKSGKSVEFGRRWIITRLMGGYVTGAPCQKIGADADTQIADEVLMNFMDTFGEVPENFIDRGADSKKNEIFLSEVGVENICIFPKGRRKMDVPPGKIFERSFDRESKIKKVQLHQAKSSVAARLRPQGVFCDARVQSQPFASGPWGCDGDKSRNYLRIPSQRWFSTVKRPRYPQFLCG